MVAPDALDQDALLRLTLEELFAFLELVQRLATLADLRQYPGRGGGPQGWLRKFAVRHTAIQRSIGKRAWAQSPLRRWSMPAAK